MASYQYVYVMKDVSRTYPGGRDVLKGITLSFFPGAKIGVIGVNGSGKSTLMKIMAGLDPDFTGEAWAATGAKVGYLSQEPQLDPDKTVLENVLEGLAETKALLDRFNEVSAKFAEPLDDDEMAALLEEQASPRRAVPAAAGKARPAAAGRTHQPPGRGIRRLAGAIPQGLHRHGDGGHP